MTFAMRGSAACLIVLLLAPAQTVSARQQPVPQQLKQAKTAYLIMSGVDPRLLDRFAKEVAAWRRFVLIDDLKKAEIVCTLSEEQLEAKGGAAPPTLIVLTITEGFGGPILWTDKERSGVTTGAAANLVKRLKEKLDKPDRSRRPLLPVLSGQAGSPTQAPYFRIRLIPPGDELLQVVGNVGPMRGPVPSPRTRSVGWLRRRPTVNTD